MNRDEWLAVRPLMEEKWSEYLAKDGDPLRPNDFWRWLAGLDHMCVPDSQTLVSTTLLELLTRDSDRLHKLQAAGVDNWDGYDDAFREDEDNE